MADKFSDKKVDASQVTPASQVSISTSGPSVNRDAALEDTRPQRAPVGPKSDLPSITASILQQITSLNADGASVELTAREKATANAHAKELINRNSDTVNELIKAIPMGGFSSIVGTMVLGFMQALASKAPMKQDDAYRGLLVLKAIDDKRTGSTDA